MKGPRIVCAKALNYSVVAYSSSVVASRRDANRIGLSLCSNLRSNWSSSSSDTSGHWRDSTGWRAGWHGNDSFNSKVS